MKRLVHFFNPWYQEKEAMEKEERIKNLDAEATSQISRAQQVVKSYRDYTVIMTTAMRK